MGAFINTRTNWSVYWKFLATIEVCRQKEKQMKFQCDVCDKDEALVFCIADEAALCEACDHRVHHANKLAYQHRRFSLHPSTSDNQFPVCDICQERRAFMFCHQDRAILCRECDIPIHTVNEHTQKHDRYLLTGAKISFITPSASSSSEAGLSINGLVFNPDPNSQPLFEKTTNASDGAVSNSHSIAESSTSNAPIVNNEAAEPISTSSMSDYLIETIPEWHFEEFLDSTSATFGFCKSDDGAMEVESILMLLYWLKLVGILSHQNVLDLAALFSLFSLHMREWSSVEKRWG